MINIPRKCNFIFEILEQNGYECFAVGGCVRDSIMGRKPSDWDFTTNALPDDILRCFAEYKTIPVGKEYGTIAVESYGNIFEITTYRIDGEYTDSRHPDSVLFSSSVVEDLRRRDFTINSMAYSPKCGLIDPFGGLEDIKNRVIRCTGVAKDRFSEDALRILRALRFSSELKFTIEEETKKAILECKDSLALIHPNRLRKEFTGILMGKSERVLYDFRDVLAVIIPEIKPMFDLPQNNPHHQYDVWKHTVVALSYAMYDEIIKLAVFFHDIGKPAAKTTDEFGIDHFRNHQKISEETARSVMQRFCYPKSTIDDVCLLVRYHDERFRNMQVDIKRVLGAVTERLFYSLSLVAYADMMAQSDYMREEKLVNWDNVIVEARRIINDGECYSLAQLAVNGNDLMQLGYKGKDIGTILNTLLKMVIKEKVDNDKEQLLRAVPSLTLTS